MANDNVIDYPLMTRQREEEIQQGELARADDVNAEFNSIIDVYNRLVGLLQGEWGGDTGRIYELVDEAVRTANEALAKAEGAVLRKGDTMQGQLNQSAVPVSEYNLVNKKYVDTQIQDELSEPINRISTLEDRLDNLKATQVKLENENFTGKNVNDGMNELFISVSNGKKIIAAAITDKGVPTSGDDSFKQMRDNIMSIVTFNEGTAGGTATPADVIKGKTFYARQNFFTGTYVPLDTSDATATEDDIVIGKSAYVNGRKIYGTNTGIYIPSGPITGTDTSDATAGPEDIRVGKTAYAQGNKIEGTLMNVAVEEVFSLKEEETYMAKDINNYVNKIGIDIPGSKITIMPALGILFSNMTNNNLPVNQARIVDAIKIEVGGKTTRYIRARLLDNGNIVIRANQDLELTEKILYSFTELGLNPDEDVQFISIGSYNFRSISPYVSSCGLAIVQGNTVHIYKYDYVDNIIGIDPKSPKQDVWHWFMKFDEDIKCAVAPSNRNPNIFAVVTGTNKNNKFAYLIEPRVNAYSDGRIEGFISTSKSDAIIDDSSVPFSTLKFSMNDNYLIANSEDNHKYGITYSGPKTAIFSINTEFYTFNNHSATVVKESPCALFHNERNAVIGGYIYNLSLDTSHKPVLERVDDVQHFTKSYRYAFASLDNNFLVCYGYKKRAEDSIYSNVYVYYLNPAQPDWEEHVTVFNTGAGMVEQADTCLFNIDTSQGVVLGRDGNAQHFIRGFNTENVVAIKYNNIYWYNNVALLLSATPEDVVKGKTFIGLKGLPEEGTKEVAGGGA